MPLEQEFDFFLKNQNQLVQKYNDKHLVVKENKVIGVFNSYEEAYFETQKVHALGTFLIQHCISGAEAYTQHFSSPVVSF